jgi:hypothetical protein
MRSRWGRDWKEIWEKGEKGEEWKQDGQMKIMGKENGRKEENYEFVSYTSHC